MKVSRTQFLGALGAAAGAGLLAPIARAEKSTPQATPPATRDAPQVAGALDSQKFRAAVVAGDIDTVGRYLATDPALRYANDDEGRSVFILAHLAGHPEIAELFVELGLPLDIVEASIVGDWDRVNELGRVAPGLVNADHPIGGTAMYAAALFGHGVPMFRLNGVGGDPNGNPRLEEGFTPVRAAMNCRDPIGAERAATYLIGNGGDGPGGCGLHSPSYDFNDAILGLGAKYWVQLVESQLPSPQA